MIHETSRPAFLPHFFHKETPQFLVSFEDLDEMLKFFSREWKGVPRTCEEFSAGLKEAKMLDNVRYLIAGYDVALR
jgi:hypothetical protein